MVETTRTFTRHPVILQTHPSTVALLQLLIPRPLQSLIPHHRRHVTSHGRHPIKIRRGFVRHGGLSPVIGRAELRTVITHSELRTVIGHGEIKTVCLVDTTDDFTLSARVYGDYPRTTSAKFQIGRVFDAFVEA